MHLTLIVASVKEETQQRGDSEHSKEETPLPAYDDVRLSSLKINGNAFNLFLGVLSFVIALALRWRKEEREIGNGTKLAFEVGTLSGTGTATELGTAGLACLERCN